MTGAVGGLAVVTDALDTVIDLGPGRLDAADLDELIALRSRIDERLARGDGLTVAAVAGGTGVGKSALVNRLVGSPVATEGVVRPTTDQPVAATRQLDAAVSSLLGWLDISDRREVDGGLPAGLVLVDLPDHDSIAEHHRLTAARLAERVDALVVVVDPLKYARADLHHGPLAELTEHAEVVTVVLNRIDELEEGDVERCRADLARQLQATGLAGVRLLSTSASTGAGVDELRAHLGQLAARQQSAARRLTGDAAHLARRIRDGLPDRPARGLEVEALLEPLLEATDAHRAGTAAEVIYRRDARAAVRSPLARVARMPLDLTVRVGRSLGIEGAVAADPPRRSPARVERVLAHELALHDTTGVTHVALGQSIEETARIAGPVLADAVDRVSLHPDRRGWWSGMAWLRGLAELIALVGFGWLVLLGVVRWLQLPELPTPQLTDALSWPAALLLCGVVVRVALGLITRAVVALGARRHGQHTRHAISDALAGAIHTSIVEPFEAEVRRHDDIRGHLDQLAG